MYNNLCICTYIHVNIHKLYVFMNIRTIYVKMYNEHQMYVNIYCIS